MTVYVCPRCGGTLAIVRRPGDPEWSVMLPACCLQCRAERDRASAAQLVGAIIRERERLHA